MNYLIVFIGAGIGGMARHGINGVALRLLGPNSFPFGTLSINILGSLLMGVVIEYFALKSGLTQQARLFLTTGILGGFTTFSTFSLEAALLFERGEAGASLIYMLASVVLSVGALFMAMIAFRSVLGGNLV
jgi:CrcB protein